MCPFPSVCPQPKVENQKLCHGFKERGLEGNFGIIEFMKPPYSMFLESNLVLSPHSKSVSVPVRKGTGFTALHPHPALPTRLLKSLVHVNDFFKNN